MPTSITGHLWLEIAIIATPWNKIHQILHSGNYVCMFVDLQKRLFVKKTQMIQMIQLLTCQPFVLTPLSPTTLYNDKPMSLSMV